MSTQKFTAAQREALWHTHERKCAYTRESIDVANFHIDHIIPEFLANDPKTFVEWKEKYSLKEDFDIFGFENLLPCKCSVNLQKHDSVFDPAQIHYFLGIASDKKVLVNKLHAEIVARNNKGKSLIMLQDCLERGVLTPREVANILEKHQNEPQEIYELIEALEFANEKIKVIDKSCLTNMRNLPIKLGLNRDLSGVTLTNNDGNEIFVRTCNEYDLAIKANYRALSNFDIKMSVFFEQKCQLLKLFENATIAKVSYVKDPRVGITDLHLLPFGLFPFVEQSTNEELTETYQNKVNSGTLIIKRVKNNAICVEEAEGMGHQLIEVARADFNGDGIEDILLFEACYATHGTLGFGGIKILTRLSENGLFKDVTSVK